MQITKQMMLHTKLIILLIAILSLSYSVEGKKKRGIKFHKAHPHHHAHKAHIHHVGAHHHSKHHRKHTAPPLIQSTTPVPLYSPPFVGIENGQIPTDSQVALIMDWLAKVGSTVDVFLRLQGTYPEGSQEQRQLVKNVYPPLRVLLESQYSYEFKNAQM